MPHGQSVLLYEALAAAGNDVTLRLIDGLPHTFFNRSTSTSWPALSGWTFATTFFSKHLR